MLVPLKRPLEVVSFLYGKEVFLYVFIVRSLFRRTGLNICEHRVKFRFEVCAECVRISLRDYLLHFKVGLELLTKNWHVFCPGKKPLAEVYQHIEQRFNVISWTQFTSYKLIIRRKEGRAFETVLLCWVFTGLILVHGQSEINQDDLVLLEVRHYILRLDVIVHEATVMHSFESFHHL